MLIGKNAMRMRCKCLINTNCGFLEENFMLNNLVTSIRSLYKKSISDKVPWWFENALFPTLWSLEFSFKTEILKLIFYQLAHFDFIGIINLQIRKSSDRWPWQWRKFAHYSQENIVAPTAIVPSAARVANARHMMLNDSVHDSNQFVRNSIKNVDMKMPEDSHSIIESTFGGRMHNFT